MNNKNYLGKILDIEIDSELIEKVNEKIPQKFVKILSRTRR